MLSFRCQVFMLWRIGPTMIGSGQKAGHNRITPKQNTTSEIDTGLSSEIVDRSHRSSNLALALWP